MSILGQAIAKHLVGLHGLYSVELPEQTIAEARRLVEQANLLQPNRALFVTDDPASAAGVTSIQWREILGWRTEDDRIFVWKRGIREPDTSFRSVVRPFISNRFPGAGGGECSLDMLVELSVRELWAKRTLPPIGDSYDAFVKTGRWVAEVLYLLFEQTGSLPGNHWSDRFVSHWAQMLDALDTAWTAYAGPIDPRHAWEFVRLSGLPLPSQIANGNPFLGAPAELEEHHWPKLAELWADVVRSFILPEGAIAAFLTALDGAAVGAAGVTPWRQLDWGLVTPLPEGSPAPTVGFTVFASPPSPSLISSVIPSFPVAPIPSWWGVSTNELDEALRHLREQTPLLPDTTCTGLIRLFPNDPTPYVLNTRVAGALAYAHTAKKWRARITLSNIRLRFKEDWQQLHVSPISPTAAADGDAWINPDAVQIEAKGADTEGLSVSPSPGNQLLIQFRINIEYTAARDQTGGTLTGKWIPERSIRAQLRVRRYFNGSWDTGRDVNAEIELLIPSPFAPTVLISSQRRLEGCAPLNHDVYVANINQGNLWLPSETPTIVLDEEGPYSVQIFDGSLTPSAPQFASISQLAIDGQAVGAPNGGWFPATACDINDGLVIEDISGAQPREITVLKVKERSGNLSSGLLSAVRGMPAGRRQPFAHSRGSIQGQYQDRVTQGLGSHLATGQALPNSLYQYVVSSSIAPVEWPQHSGSPPAELLIPAMRGFVLPGIGNGPSQELTRSAEWRAFMQTLAEICGALGLRPGRMIWLSGLDFGDIPTQLVCRYLRTHADLVAQAKQLQPADFFWASYPFSVMVVEGRSGIDFGQLLAVMLSPLHPARFAWAFSVAKVARSSSGVADPALFSLAEGWNIPCSGTTLNAAGQRRQLVAIPTNPGDEQDFLAWSALAVLSDSGIAEVPVLAAGQPLPWGGRTGLNARVVERAISDYLSVHPHVNSFQLDIRSVSQAPRSQEIDAAVLDLVGGAGAEGIAGLGGGTRVWDSEDRQGVGPNRDALFAVRTDEERDRPFEWRTYSPTRPPLGTDVALIENASVHLALVPGSAEGIIGLLPLRRFSPATIVGLALDQNFSPSPSEDLLGLARLLREIENFDAGIISALRAIPQVHALGLGGGANWEVLGTFNLDPSVLSNLVASAAQAGPNRLLWEWRPSWMPVERKLADLARRPYYVIARIPVSLIEALVRRQGFTTERAEQLLQILGLRGIGLAALSAHAGTGESAAAGFFYALQLLMPVSGQNPLTGRATATLPVLAVVPIDPLVGLLEALAFRPLTKRGDILAVGISTESEGSIKLCFVPVEVKHHGMPSDPAPLPPASDRELTRARQQLAETSKVLSEIAAAIANPTNGGVPYGNYLRRLGIATLVDLALSFLPSPMMPVERARILRSILNSGFKIGVGDAVLLRFAPGTLVTTGAACLVDPYGTTVTDGVRIREVFIDPTPLPALWWSGVQPGPNELVVWSQVVQVLRSAFEVCRSSPASTAADVADPLRAALGLPPSTAATRAPDAAPSGQEPFPSTGPAGQSKSDIRIQSPATSHPPGTATPSAATSEPQFTADLTAMGPTESEATETSGLTSASPSTATPDHAPAAAGSSPRVFVGWSNPTLRWAFVGKLHGSNDTVALDLDHPKTIGIFGYMGSGKSYLLGNLIEASAQRIPGINHLPFPLAVVVFNYRRNAADRFELSSLASPNANQSDIERLQADYSATPDALRDVHVLCLPGELRPERQQEYARLPAKELFFDPRTLGAEDWELLMGEPGSEAVFARTIRNTLVEMRSAGPITLNSLEQQTNARLSGQSRTAATLRFEFVRRYISEERGCDFAQLLRPGGVLVVDLRQPLFNKDDALRFFLVCANQISGVQSQFNKMIVFDEAHEYLSAAFGERMESRIRLMRHEGTTYVFATQDVGSIPPQISRFLTTRFVFDLGTRENVEDLERVAPDFRGYQVMGIRPGRCFLQSTASTQSLFSRPREIEVRPRVTQHGGQSRIFSTRPNPPQP